MKLYANLHSHSTHSDGVYSPSELVRVAKAEGYKAIALTDHDAVSGSSELRDECQREGLDCVFGCEFSSYFEELDTTYHIVGFNFDGDYPEMREYLEKRGASETEQTRILTERGLREGLISGITWDEVLEFNRGVAWLCNEHVFRLLLAKGIMTETDKPRYFRTVFGKRRDEVEPLYPFMAGRDILKLIERAGGFAVVAHPADIYGSIKDMPELMKMGARGVEVWHSLMSDEDRREALRIARDNKLFISGGSDHDGLLGGLYKNYDDPKKCPFWVEEQSLGTTEEFFREIKSGILLPERADYINEYLKKYDR